MQILVSCDDSVRCDEELFSRVEGVVAGMLDGLGDQISRVDVRLGDDDDPDPGARDKSCRLEARGPGLGSVVAVHEAFTLTEAIHGAASKLERLVVRGLRQLRNLPQSLSLNGESDPEPSK
jgi:hypothetical protein